MLIAIITGASSGLGREFARLLSARPDIDELWLVARRRERMEELAATLAKPCRVWPVNLSDPEQITSFARNLEAAVGTDGKPVGVRYLINNAGFGKMGDFVDVPVAEQLDMVDVNIRAVVQLTHAVLPYMEKNSEIVNLASSAGFLPLGGFAVYGAVKAFVINWSAALLAELRGRSIHSIAVCPGPVDTEFFERSKGSSGAKKKMMNKRVSPDKVAAKALRDSAKRRAVSTYGFGISLLNLVARFIGRKSAATITYDFIYGQH